MRTLPRSRTGRAAGAAYVVAMLAAAVVSFLGPPSPLASSPMLQAFLTLPASALTFPAVPVIDRWFVALADALGSTGLRDAAPHGAFVLAVLAAAALNVVLVGTTARVLRAASPPVGRIGDAPADSGERHLVR